MCVEWPAVLGSRRCLIVSAARSGGGKLQLERGALIGRQQPDRSAMTGHHGLDDRKPHPGPAGVAAGGKEGVEDAVAVGFGDRVAVVTQGYAHACIARRCLDLNGLGVMTERIVGEM